MLNPRILALSAVCVVTPLAFGQVDPQARQVLEKMVETIEQAETITYRVQMHGEGGMFGMLPRSTGTVTMKRQTPPAAGITGNWRIRMDGRTTGTDQPFEFLVVSDGQRYSWLDHENRRLIYRAHSASRGRPTDTAAQILIPSIAEGSPLQRDLAAPTIQLVEQVTLDGEVCDVVLVDPGEMMPKTNWTIARSDGLPRRAEWLVQGGAFDNRQIWTITNVKLNAEYDDSLFALVAPEGFSTIGAPVTARPQMNPAADDRDDADGLTAVGPRAPAPRTIGTAVGNIAPDFELPKPNGEKVRLSDLRGEVVLLDFWGTWCLPCRRSSPLVQKVHEDYHARGVKVLGLAVRERNDENPINYMKEHNYTYGLLLRADDVASKFGVLMYPTFIVIGREGEIVHIENSFDPSTTFPQLRGAIDRALSSGAGAGKTIETGDGDNRTTVTGEENEGERREDAGRR